MIASAGGVLLDPWRDEGTRRALIEVLLLGTACGALGCWLVFHRLSYAAESLAHAMLPGLVLAALLGFPLLLGGAAGLLVGAGAVALASRSPVIEADTAVAVVVTALLGLGGLLALSAGTPPGLSELLFGDVLGLRRGDLAVAGALAVVVLGVLSRVHQGLLVVGFDRAGAGALGRSPLVADLILGALLTLTLLVAVQALGNLLVVAILIAPAAAARRVATRPHTMALAAIGFAAAGGVAGLYASYHLETAAGASIAGALVAGYVVAEAIRLARSLVSGAALHG